MSHIDRILVGLFLTLGFSIPTFAQSADQYYLTIFGAGSNPFRVRQTHTFATASRLTTNNLGMPTLENQTISWMPATLWIRPFGLRPEPGVNLSLSATFRWIESVGTRTSVWGPFRIPEERYHQFLKSKDLLESGRIRYRAIGSLGRDKSVSNCGQSFTRAGPVGQRYLQPTPFPGEPGTSRLVVRCERVYGWQLVAVPELLSAVVQDPHPLVYRQPGERIRHFFRR